MTRRAMATIAVALFLLVLLPSFRNEIVSLFHRDEKPGEEAERGGNER